ncbi:hypothetical protein NDU88_000941 [Pleurodeles waltl]|uniref:Uncharacterized protein n=1 Tax=Pleurodeles waltl TaxID=8319 RepID=A0AAV7VAF0_PLEWA|nr:hypothetical protein NDU88_000941 [Pleurodeles waltl]
MLVVGQPLSRPPAPSFRTCPKTWALSCFQKVLSGARFLGAGARELRKWWLLPCRGGSELADLQGKPIATAEMPRDGGVFKS